MSSKGMLIAGAVATLFLSGAVVAQAEDKAGGEVKCAGVNECKGKGSCAGGTGGNSCAGMNSCKGKGVVDMSAADCTAKGGKVVK